MESWKKLKLGDLFERVTRKNTNLESNNVLTISAQYGLINQEEFFNKSVAGKNLKNYYLLKKGEFAYNKSYSTGYPMGATKMLEKYDEGVVSTLYICFRSKSDLVNKEYFKYYFESKQYYDELSKIAQEGARNHGLLNISVDDFFDIQVILPPINEQEKIVKLIEKVDLIKKSVNKEIEKIEKVKGYYLNKIFSLEAKNIKKIEDIASIYIGLTYTPTYTKAGIPFISCKNIKNKKIDWSDYNYISEKEFQMITDNAKPQKGDILFGRVGTLGKPVILEENKKICIFVSVGYIRIKDQSKCLNEFLDQWMNSSNFKKILEKKIAGSSQKNLNTGWLKKFEINLPTMEEQVKWSKLLKIYDNYINNLEKKEKEYNNIRKCLMQKLLTGKIREKI